jgi:multiple sugar transport system ATP-binding protein
MNFIPTVVRASTDGRILALAASGRKILTIGDCGEIAEGSPAELGVRPDAILVVSAESEEAVPATIVVVEHLGGSSLLYVQIDGIEDLITVELRGITSFTKDQRVDLLFDPAHAHLFDSDGERIARR